MLGVESVHIASCRSINMSAVRYAMGDYSDAVEVEFLKCCSVVQATGKLSCKDYQAFLYVKLLKPKPK